jgi:oligogalacturonide transporter
LIFFVGPVVLIALALFFSWSFKLNKHTHTLLKQELDRLEDGGSKTEVNKETQKVVEELTGHPYSTLWPNNQGASEN